MASPADESAMPTRPGLGRPFWLFFLVTFFFDLGFGLYFFLINLYLSQIHFDEKTIGLIAGALTLGNVIATVPTGLLARRIGLRPMFAFALIAAPLFGAARGFSESSSLQIGLAFLQGVAMCSYTVCFPPAVARLTSEDRRTTAFSVTFATGIGSGALAGLAGGWIPGWLHQIGRAHDISSGMRMVLLLACVIVFCGLLPLLRCRFPDATKEFSSRSGISGMSLFLVPFLTAVAVWNVAISAFAPFANLYLSSVLRVSLAHVGLIFSASQCLQVLGVSVAPLLYRALGKARGIACMQLAAAASLLLLGHVRHAPFAIAVYLSLMCFQYTCCPGIYSLAMDRTALHLQSSVSAWQNMITCVSAAVAAAAAGVVIAQSGYSTLLTVAAVFALIASTVFASIDSVWLRGRPAQKVDSEVPLEAAARE